MHRLWNPQNSPDTGPLGVKAQMRKTIGCHRSSCFGKHGVKLLSGVQADALEIQTTKVKKLQEDIEQPQSRPRAELEAELAEESGALSGMQVLIICPNLPSI